MQIMQKGSRDPGTERMLFNDDGLWNRWGRSLFQIDGLASITTQIQLVWFGMLFVSSTCSYDSFLATHHPQIASSSSSSPRTHGSQLCRDHSRVGSCMLHAGSTWVGERWPIITVAHYQRLLIRRMFVLDYNLTC
jgi:hypothetical protein